jgi:SPP1 family predicted phage head-tail adaptor
MRAGNLRHVIDIQSVVKSADGMGGWTEAWSSLYSGLRASVWPLSGSEILESLKLEHSVTHRIRIRYREGIKADMRVSFDSRTFNIKSVIVPQEKRVMVELMCEEIDGES